MTGQKPLSPKNKIGDSTITRVRGRYVRKIKIVLLMLVVLGCSVLAFILVASKYMNNGNSSLDITLKITDTESSDNINLADSAEIEYIERQTGIDPVVSVIWLHGLGADGHNFEPIVPQLNLPDNLSVRFIFPHAPIRPITVNNGMEMRGWYDIVDLPIDLQRVRHEDRPGLEASEQIVKNLVDQENRRGIPTNKIFLVGFSQGGAIALFAGLRLKAQLAGIIALSCYLPDAPTTESEKSSENLTTAIFMGHGTQDPLIPLSIGHSSYDKLKELGYNVEWHSYDMPHSVHPQEIDDIGEFISKLVSR